MLKWVRTTAIVTAMVFGTAAVTSAQVKRNATNTTSSTSNQVVITNAKVDRANELLVINGQNFGDVAPGVWLNGSNLTVVSATQNQLVAVFPAAIPDGSYLLVVDRGPSQDWFDLTTVSAGPQGPAGPAGPQGLKGDTGAQGPQGVQGVKGDTGAQGPQGLQGLKGDTGAQGPQGLQGLKGDTGPQGPQGLKGDQGQQGLQGDTGATGPQGLKGDTGAQGTQGLQGDVGPVGPAGPAGPAGPVGPVGPAGLTGPTGPQGAQGAQGPQGFQGPAGPVGPAGPAGSNGVSGYEVVNGVVPATGGTSVSPGIMFTASVACTTGKLPVGGGFEAVGGAPQLNLVGSFPYANGSNGWKVELRNNTAATVSNVQVRVYVICGLVL